MGFLEAAAVEMEVVGDAAVMVKMKVDLKSEGDAHEAEQGGKKASTSHCHERDLYHSAPTKSNAGGSCREHHFS